MKPSRYNLFVTSADGAVLAFNSATAALAEIEPASHDIIKKLLDSPESAATDYERELRGYLVQGGYLIDDSVDEISVMRDLNRARRRKNKTFFLTIAPTMACNFACDYCFESHRGVSMTGETREALLEFSAPYLAAAEAMEITWFGGEPTLAVNLVEQMQRQFREMSELNGVKLGPASIVTNGYLLDGAMAARLIAVGVDGAQVTLDGPRRFHDARRKLRNGKGTFDRIIRNLRESAEVMKIAVRVNVDKSNLDGAQEVIVELDAAGVLPMVDVYFAQVNSTGGTCADMRDRCFSTEEFSEYQTELYRRLVDSGFYRIAYPTLAPGGHCGADSANSFVVSPTGDLFKCWEELSLNSEKSIGSIFSSDKTVIQQENLARYESWEPFLLADCVDCDILPICMGGCPYRGITSASARRGYCCSWRFNLKEMLRLRYRCEQLKPTK